MSVRKWAYEPWKCDGDFCPNDCSLCRKAFWVKDDRDIPSSGCYRCFNCGAFTVVWDSDFSFEDCGYIGDGLVHMLHCNNCGAKIEYRISDEVENERD